VNILHCIYDHIGNPWVGGGGAARVHEIYRRISPLHEIMVVCGAYPGAEHYTEEKVQYKFLGTLRDNYVLSTFSYALRAARYIKEHAHRFDVVVEDFAPYNPVCSFRRHRNAVIQLHQREGLRHLKKYAVIGIPFFLIEKYYPRMFGHAVSESEIGRERYGLGENCRVIPNGFDPRFLTLEAVEEDYVLFLGRLHIEQKGIDTLCDASRLIDFRLLIAGGGKDEIRTRALFRKDAGNDRVEFAGYVRGKEKEELFRKSLFLVIPSRYEGQPVTVVEAAACGKAVVVSDIPELRYAVEEGFGLSFKKGDPADLAAKIGFLLGNPEVRREMGRKGREYARSFTWDRIAEEHERYLCEIVGGTAEA